MTAKILVLDIETAPETAYIWKRFKESVGQTQVKAPGYLLCMAYRRTWLNEKVQTMRIYNNRSWLRGDRTDDKALAVKARELLDEADIVVGHNIRKFDIGTLNARFVFHKLTPPSPYKVDDTLETLKKRFHLPSNSLESASHYFGIDIKEKQHFSLWRDCMNGVPEAWECMTTYCAHDVEVVEQLREKLLPWNDNHPNVGVYEADGSAITCPKCGSHELKLNGTQRTSVHSYQRYQCKGCGGYARSRTPLKNDRSHVLTHAVVS